MPRPSKSLKSAPHPSPDYTDRAYWSGAIKMSLSKFFVLCVLHQRPMHGYEIVRVVEETTHGCCSPSEGTIYPVLSDFEAGGYVIGDAQVVNGRERRVFTLTDRGREAFRVAATAWLEVTDRVLEAGKLAIVALPGSCCSDGER
ncbi:MAG: PadR family transcriptional regulator [Hyphomicrobiales bacterium]|nr:PadR family transcriptional regulator [Hyphomicrobiales bacterium]